MKNPDNPRLHSGKEVSLAHSSLYIADARKEERLVLNERETSTTYGRLGGFSFLARIKQGKRKEREEDRGPSSVEKEGEESFPWKEDEISKAGN